MRNEDEFKYLKPTNPLLTKGSEGGFIPQVAMLRHARDGERSRTIRNPQSNGFTLIEIIITIVVTSIIAGLSAVIILQGVRSYSDEDTRSDLHYQTRLAVERMAREIRMVNSQGNVGTVAIGTITGNPTNSFIFTDLTGTNVRFWLNGQTLNRTVAGVDSALAMGVTTLEFRHYDNTITLTTTAASVWAIDILVTDTKGSQSLPVRTRVHPRNF